MSTGHGSVAAGASASCSAIAVFVRETVVATGMTPGCQVTVAVLSSVTTAPAAFGWTASVPTTAGGSGADATGAVVTADAGVDPALFRAVTSTVTVVPRSPGVRT